MKKLSLLFMLLFAIGITTTSCREEGKEVEVQELRDDANDSSDDEGYDTNPTENDPD